jgi:hypothetical protein
MEYRAFAGWNQIDAAGEQRSVVPVENSRTERPTGAFPDIDAGKFDAKSHAFFYGREGVSRPYREFL